MMVRTSACLPPSQPQAGPPKRHGGVLLPTLVMIASAVIGAIASFHLIGLLHAANGSEGMPSISGDRCLEQVVKGP